MEAVFGEQLVEVVAGDAAGNARKLLPDERGVAVAEAREAGVDLADAAAGADQRVKLLGRRGADGHARAVVEHDVEGFDVVDDFAAQQAVHAATVVADHAAEGAAGVRGGVGRVGEVMQLRRLRAGGRGRCRAERWRAWLRGIDRGEGVHEARIIEDHGYIGALAGEAGARAARQNGSAGCAAGGQRGLDIGGVAGKDDADGKLAVVGGVGGIEGAGAKIEAAHRRAGIS